MPRFRITNEPGRRSSIETLDSGERLLSYSERALQAQLQRSRGILRRRNVEPRYVELYDNIARIPIPAEWPHGADLHPIEYLGRFPNGGSAALAEQCCEAMVTWWQEHGKKNLKGEPVDSLPRVSLEAHEANVEMVSAPASRAEALDTNLHTMNTKDALEAIAQQFTVATLEGWDKAERRHPSYKNGRKGVLRALKDRIRDLKEAEAQDAAPEPQAEPAAVVDPLKALEELEREEAEAEEDLSHLEDADDDEPPAELAAAVEATAEDAAPQMKRFPCPEPGCPVDAATEKGLAQHIRVKHGKGK